MTYSLSLILLAVLPFQFAVPLWGAGETPIARLLAIAILGSFLIESLLSRSWRLPMPVFTGVLVSFLIIATTSAVWAAYPEFSFPKIAFLLNTLPLIFVWYGLFAREERALLGLARATVSGAVGAAMVASAFFLAQFVFGVGATFHFIVEKILPFFLGREFAALVANYPSLLVNIGGETVLRATAVFPDPHVAAYFFGMLGFLALGMARRTGSTRYLLAAGIIFVADLLTFSRGGYLGLIAGTGAYFFMLAPGFWSDSKNRVRLALFMLVLVLVVLSSPVSGRFLSSFQLSDASSTGRIALWQEGFIAITERPLLGVGLGNYLSSARPLLAPEAPFYAHNLYLDIALEVGLIGLAAFLAVFIAAFASARTGRDNPLAASTVAALALYLAHSLVETPIFSVHATLVLVFILAVALFLRRPAS